MTEDSRTIRGDDTKHQQRDQYSQLSWYMGSNSLWMAAFSLSTGIGSLAAIAGTKLAGEIDYFGAEQILFIQAGIFVTGALLTSRLHPAPPISAALMNNVQPQATSTIATIRDGLRQAWNIKIARDVIGLNSFSSFFNAGAWIVAIPFIVTRVYAGDAAFLAKMVMIFTFGTLLANFGLLKFMPLARPGRIFLIMQLTRILVLAILWMQPEEYLLFGTACYWGFNMGISSTMSRLMVQEIAPATHRSRIMSIYTLGMMAAVPVGAITLGYIIGQWGPLNALIPGMIASLCIFIFGIRRTEIWRYESPVGS